MATGSDSPDRVVRDDLCIGCGACALALPSKVSMEEGASGFLQARQRSILTKSEAESFSKYCPARGYGMPARPTDRGPESLFWGPVIRTRSAWASDKEVRERGSSGGTLTALAGYVLDSGRVDAVIAIGAGPSALANQAFVIRRSADMHRVAGSRYSPAAPLLGLREVNAGDRVAIIGKPCDIAAIRRLADMGGAGLPEIRYFFSFFCAGTPSWHATRAAADKALGTSESLTSIRYRGNGWPGSFRAETAEGTVGEMSYEDSWGSVLNKQLHNRCKTCQDGAGSYADIVAADNWEANAAGYPVFTESDGQSALLSRTEVGEALLSEALAAGALDATDEKLDKLNSIQPSQVTRKKFAGARSLGFAIAGKPTTRFRGFPTWRWAVSNPGQFARQLVGSYRRARAGAQSDEK